MHPDEMYSRPINPAKYDVLAFNVADGGRGEIQICRSMPEVLRNALKNCLDGFILIDSPNKLTILVSNGLVGPEKLELAARLIRAYEERDLYDNFFTEWQESPEIVQS